MIASIEALEGGTGITVLEFLTIRLDFIAIILEPLLAVIDVAIGGLVPALSIIVQLLRAAFQESILYILLLCNVVEFSMFSQLVCMCTWPRLKKIARI